VGDSSSSIPSAYSVRRQNGSDKNSWETVQVPSLLRTVLEGRMEVTRTRGRQSDMMIDWMKSNDVDNDQIKKRAHDREDWCHWRPGPA